MNLMIAVGELLQRHGIELESTAPGRHYTTCPRCSKDRKPEHRNAKCLGVTIERDGAHWGCNHCGWRGPEKGAGNNGNAADDLTAYDYADADGKLLFQKVRKPPGSPGDRFFVRRPDGRGGWIGSLKGVPTPRPLYRWPEIVKAMKEDREIAIVEGEKDADNLWRLGIPTTCNFDGASDVIKNPKAKPKWKADYSERLRGAPIIVFNDNDAPGYAHADAVCRMSLGISARVRRLDLALHWPGIPNGGDVSDYLAAGHTAARLLELIEAAPEYVPAGGEPSAPGETSASEAPAKDDDAELERLARMPAFEYERARTEAAKRLGVRVAMLDRLVAAKRKELGLDADDGRQGRAVSFPEPEPWPEPVNGAELLNAVGGVIRRHVVLGDAACDTTALWILHTYLTEQFAISPRLCVRSPMKGCGKTLMLDVLAPLVRRPLPTANVTPAAVFRVIEKYHPTLLVDEADTFIRESDELRGVLNSGHRKGGQVLRTVGDDHEPRAFSTYGPCAVALIGSLPDTLHDRSVVVDLKRRLKTELVESFRCDRTGHLDALARKAARWAAGNGAQIGEIDPAVPAGIVNREADNWRPLLAIADIAGGGWPDRARRAAETAHAAGAADDASSLVEILLCDVRAILTERNSDRIASAELVTTLVEIEGRPWAEMGKTRKPLTQNRLAKLLRPLRIAPETIRIEDKTAKGYLAHRFTDAFARFCPEGGSQPSQRNKADEQRTSEAFQTVTSDPDVTVQKCEKSNNDGLRYGITVEKGGAGARTRNGPPPAYRPKVTGTPRLELIGLEPDGTVCVQCGSASAPVYLIRDPGRGVAREALHEHCARLFFPHEVKGSVIRPDEKGGFDEIGMSQRTIDILAAWYGDTYYERRDEPEIEPWLGRELRRRLRDEFGVLQEFIAVEATRVIDQVFGRRT
jgi:hypothetical protein